MKAQLNVRDVAVLGHLKAITLRSNRPALEKRMLPIVVYLHRAGFTAGSLEEADHPAS
jgi:hypothetical protein